MDEIEDTQIELDADPDEELLADTKEGVRPSGSSGGDLPTESVSL